MLYGKYVNYNIKQSNTLIIPIKYDIAKKKLTYDIGLSLNTIYIPTTFAKFQYNLIWLEKEEQGCNTQVDYATTYHWKEEKSKGWGP